MEEYFLMDPTMDTLSIPNKEYRWANTIQHLPTRIISVLRNTILDVGGVLIYAVLFIILLLTITGQVSPTCCKRWSWSYFLHCHGDCGPFADWIRNSVLSDNLTNNTDCPNVSHHYWPELPGMSGGNTNGYTMAHGQHWSHNSILTTTVNQQILSS